MTAWNCRAPSRGMNILPTAPCTIIRHARGCAYFWIAGSANDPRRLLPLGELLREIGDGLGVNLRRIPLQQHLEVRRSFAPRLALLPAIAFEIIRGPGEYVRHAVDEVAAA